MFEHIYEGCAEIVETWEKDNPLKYHQKVNQGTFYYRKFLKVNAIITNLPLFIDPQKPQTQRNVILAFLLATMF